MLPKIATPTFSVELPVSKKKMNVRPYTVKEDKILLMAAQNMELKEVTAATRSVINACVEEDGFDVKDLPTVDADYLLLRLRAKSVGEKETIDITCQHKKDEDSPECGNKMEIPIDITDVIIDGKIPTKEQNVINISKDVGIRMKPTTFEATLTIDPDGNDIDNNIAIIYASIDQIFDKEDVFLPRDFSKKEFGEWVDNLETSSFATLTDYINDLPKLVLHKKFKCDKCGFEHDLRFDEPINFF